MHRRGNLKFLFDRGRQGDSLSVCPSLCLSSARAEKPDQFFGFRHTSCSCRDYCVTRGFKTACGPCTNRCSGRPMKHQSWRPCLRKPVDGGSWPGRLDILPHSAVSPWRRSRCQGAGSGAWRGGRRGRADVVDACRRVGHVNLRLARGRAAFLDHLRTGRRRCRTVEGGVCGIPREAQSVAEVFLICILFAKKPTRISYVMQLKCRKF